jgi:serine/threonine protein kinase
VCKSNHMPPEVHRNECVGVAEVMNHSVDWFSLGVLLFRLVAASYPPSPRHSTEEWKAAMKKFSCSRPLVNLLQRLMEADYKQRLGSSSQDGEEIFTHAFVKRVLPSVLLCADDGALAQLSTSQLREIIREKRLRPVFQPFALQLPC